MTLIKAILGLLISLPQLLKMIQIQQERATDENKILYAKKKNKEFLEAYEKGDLAAINKSLNS